MGITNLHDYMVDEEIKNGNLVEVLPDWKQTNRDIYAVFQQRRDGSPKIEAFLAFMRELFDGQKI